MTLNATDARTLQQIGRGKDTRQKIHDMRLIGMTPAVISASLTRLRKKGLIECHCGCWSLTETGEEKWRQYFGHLATA
jgi:Mn-dependent DtxR family transcriptional regulator